MTHRSTQFRRVWRVLFGVVGLGCFSSLLPSWSWAVDFPPCPPPANNEYLLLVRGDSEAERNRIQNLLPSNSTVLVCNYLDDTVVRAGGFSNLENANAWAQYMTEVEGLQAFVARPASTTAAPTTPADANPEPTTPTTPAATPSTPTTPANPTAAASSSNSGQYNPRGLGTGYAVLVDYHNDPDIAYEIQASVGQAVGLAVYQQHPYVLIAHSPNVDGAASTLTVLSSKAIPGFIVDSQGVVMLTPAIAEPPNRAN